MNKQQFDSLSDNEKIIATEAYKDGYDAAIQNVMYMVQHVGDDTVDKMFIANRDSIVMMLELGRPK